MSYRRDLAVQTIVAVTAALRASWNGVSQEAQASLQGIIAELGPEIYAQAAFNRAGRMVALLDAIASLPDLPGPVLDALKAGEGVSGSLVKVSDEERDRALDALRTIHDARRYAEPVALADGLRLKIAQSYRNLDAGTRGKWEALDRAYAGGGSPIEYLDATAALLGDTLPFIRQEIEAGKTWSDVVYRSAARPKSPFQGSGRDLVAPPTAGAVVAPPEAPARVRRFANVYFPAKVHLAQQAVPLIVHVAEKQAEGTVTVSHGSSQLTLTVGELTISVFAEDFEVSYGLGGTGLAAVPTGATVQVRPSGDSEPVIFFLTPIATGPKKLSIDFYQGRRSVGSLAFGVEVVDAFASGAVVGQVKVDAVSLQAADGDAAPAPDLELRVIALGDGLSYEFVLTSADGAYSQRKLGRITLKSNPQAYFKSVTDELSSLARISADERGPEEDEATIRRLQEIGARLWDELLPADFKAEYRAGALDAYKGKGFIVTSDEPWIPWEMVRPFERDRGRTVINDPPLCELFRLTRWLSGGGAPNRLTVKRGVVVAPKDNLQSVQAEIDYFKQLGQRGGNGQWTVPLVTASDVRKEMDAGVSQVFHFSCHGNFQYDDADESRLKLEDDFLKPSNIRFDPNLALWQSAPLVFLNACHAGRVGMTVTRLGGWAECFIQAGASAFVGSLWEINDSLAARFAREFYDRLWGLSGQPAQAVGEAFYGARMAIKAEDPANPTWLAYVLYGDPNGRIGFGG